MRFWSFAVTPSGRIPGTTSFSSDPQGLAQGGDFKWRADHAVEPRALGEIGKAYHLILNRFAEAEDGDIVLIEAGQQRDADDERPFLTGGLRHAVGSVDGGFEHIAPAGRVHRHHEHVKPRRGSDGAGDGVGDVVEFQVEEHRHPEAGDLRNPRRAVGGEEFKPKLHRADMGTHLIGDVGGLGGHIAGVDGADDGVGVLFHAATSVTGTAFVIARSGATRQSISAVVSAPRWIASLRSQ